MAEKKPFLERLKLSGYKSIREAEIKFTALNVLIGANGAGKSNLVSYLSAMLPAALDGTLKLHDHVQRHGGADALLHFGAQRTNEVAVAATARTAEGTGVLYQRLAFGAPDSLFYSSDHSGTDERVATRGRIGDVSGDTPRFSVGKSPGLICAVAKTEGGFDTEWEIYNGLKSGVAPYHLDDTSLTSHIRMGSYVEDNGRLNPSGSNLAAVLYRYKSSGEATPENAAYRRIRSLVQKIVPVFDDFVLEPRKPDSRKLLLNWRQLGQDYLFGPHQFSDGALRAIALVTLFLQPADELPNLIIVDEPELGLHPHAALLISGLIRAASTRTQVLLATQSPTFLDDFSPEEVIVAEQKEDASQFRRVTPEELQDWLKEYSLGELWQKNVLGGGPIP